ncbi:MAG: PQQ-binding-like beta-propeller repeat protein [Fuerstiella sp.]
MKQLPDVLSPEPQVLWQLPLAHAGLGGIAATSEVVVFGDRDIDDFHDVFRCHDADTGAPVWKIHRLAIGALDYGNSPRATPLIADGKVYFLGAHGILLCVRLSDGEVLWERDLRQEFPPVGELPWGYCGSPLLVAGRLIVNPGSADASLLALNPEDGAVIWKSVGGGQGYGSLIAPVLGGIRQIVGHDASSLGGWDPETGRRLWTLVPEVDGDFNVPTPVVADGRLLVTTENNGARLFQFTEQGTVRPEPVAVNPKLRPDMSTPLVVNGRVYCVNRFLYCLDLNNGLQELWRVRDAALSDYAALVASDRRILLFGRGQLLLLKADGDSRIISRQTVFEEDVPLYAHPAVAGNRLFLRGETRLVCVEW